MMKKILSAILCASMLLSAAVSAASGAGEAPVGGGRIASSEKSSDTEKYTHAIDMDFLSDYIYGGSKSLSGKICDTKSSFPKEWRMHKCPSELPIIARAVLHIGDEGKFDNVRVSFVPGRAEMDYHQKRIDDLSKIGYAPMEINGQGNGNPNTAFYAMTTSEFDVVAYNENWVAIWSEGSLDTSRGMGGNLCATFLTKYGSWKSGVYFIPREYCYLLDINNQISYVPEIQGRGKATAPLMVKTTPDGGDYVKSGVYKINQAFQVVNATPNNGHYQIYYKEGLYYVDASNVNLQLVNVKKPAVNYIAEVSAGKSGAAKISENSDGGDAVAEAKTGATVDVLEKDCGNGYSKVWFNSKECYIKTESLTNFQSTPSTSGLTQLGAPIGTLAVDSAWGDYGQELYTADGLEFLKKANYGHIADSEIMKQYVKLQDSLEKIWEAEWVNVYKIEKYAYFEDEGSRYNNWVTRGKIYTVVHGGNVRYIVQEDKKRQTFTYYPGSGYEKKTTAKMQEMYVDSEKYSATAYNIDNNNYFKLRDIAKMMDGTVKCFDIEYDSTTNTINMLSLFPYTAAGGELAPGDGAEKTAHSSTAFLTYDGMPIQATCYNIDGNNYFKLRDVTDALDCRVEWDKNSGFIRVSTSVPAYEDPSEPVG